MNEECTKINAARFKVADDAFISITKYVVPPHVMPAVCRHSSIKGPCQIDYPAMGIGMQAVTASCVHYSMFMESDYMSKAMKYRRDKGEVHCMCPEYKGTKGPWPIEFEATV